MVQQQSFAELEGDLPTVQQQQQQPNAPVLPQTLQPGRPQPPHNAHPNPPASQFPLQPPPGSALSTSGEHPNPPTSQLPPQLVPGPTLLAPVVSQTSWQPQTSQGPLPLASRPLTTGQISSVNPLQPGSSNEYSKPPSLQMPEPFCASRPAPVNSSMNPDANGSLVPPVPDINHDHTLNTGSNAASNHLNPFRRLSGQTDATGSLLNQEYDLAARTASLGINAVSAQPSPFQSPAPIPGPPNTPKTPSNPNALSSTPGVAAHLANMPTPASAPRPIYRFPPVNPNPAPAEPTTNPSLQDQTPDLIDLGDDAPKQHQFAAPITPPPAPPPPPLPPIQLGLQPNPQVSSLGPTVGSATSSVPAPVLQPPAPPLSPPRRLRPSESQEMMRQEKLKETYDIRQVNLSDGNMLRRVPLLIQSKNGPCPLLALVNALVIRSKPDGTSVVARELEAKEKISLGLLIQVLFDELISDADESRPLPDIEELSTFLMMLHTGMNVNPCLVPITIPFYEPGTFYETQDIVLYSSFNIPLVHGWLAPEGTSVCEALKRTAKYHDDIEMLHFRKEEIVERATHGDVLTPADQLLIADIDLIHHFVKVENPTQISEYGLAHLGRSIRPGSVSILFRNDHFTTLFKHPVSNDFFTLVTDAGFANHEEVVWESLADTSGSCTEYFSGDFLPVSRSLEPSGPPPRASHQSQSQVQSISQSRITPPASSTSNPPASSAEQTDADYAYALALQFEDEEQQRSTRQRPVPPTPSSSSPPSTLPRPATIQPSPAGPRSSSYAHSQPPLPPRHGPAPGTSTAGPGDNDNAGEPPPPTYEQSSQNAVLMSGNFPGAHDMGPGMGTGSFGLDGRPTYSLPTPGWQHSQGYSPWSGRRRDYRDRDCILM